jgi:Tfp pilus assembly protein PilF
LRPCCWLFCLWLAAFSARAADTFQPTISNVFVTRLDEAKKLRERGDIPAAKAALKQLGEDAPDYYRAHYNLGLLLLDQPPTDPDAKEAIAVIEKALALRESKNIQEFSIYNTLAWAYDNAGKVDLARKAYEKAIEFESKNSIVTNRRLFTNAGLFYFAHGELDKANVCLDKAVKKYGSDTAKGFLVTSQKLHQQLELKSEFSYEARLSENDKKNSKGIILAEAAAKDGDEEVVREILMQDRANYYSPIPTQRFRDPEDTDSPGLEEPNFNRYHFISRKITLDPRLTFADVRDKSVVVKVTFTKDAIVVSPKL